MRGVRNEKRIGGSHAHVPIPPIHAIIMPYKQVLIKINKNDKAECLCIPKISVLKT